MTQPAMLALPSSVEPCAHTVRAAVSTSPMRMRPRSLVCAPASNNYAGWCPCLSQANLLQPNSRITVASDSKDVLSESFRVWLGRSRIPPVRFSKPGDQVKVIPNVSGASGLTGIHISVKDEKSKVAISRTLAHRRSDCSPENDHNPSSEEFDISLKRRSISRT